MKNRTNEMKISQNIKILIYILTAYTFSVAVRLIWIYQFSGITNFMWNGQFMINTNDGYFWAEGARDLLAGFHQIGDRSPVDLAASQLTALFVYILPFSFETVILYMPVFLSSFVVVPIILIAQSLKRVELGFIAALMAGICWSYYNRTMVGYYDTDMLNIVFPVFLLWSLVSAFNSNKEKYLIFTALEIIAYRWWYPQSYSLEFAFFGLILLYTLVYQRKNIYYYKLLTIMLFAMMGLPALARLVVVILIYFLYKSKKADKYIYYLLGFAFLSFLATGGFNPIWSQLKGYVFKESVEVKGSSLPLHFFSVMQTVSEAGKIPFETFANRISGSVVVFVFSIIGYIFMVFRYRVMLLALPLLGLGFLAYVGGLRFTIYAVPVLALGLAFLIVEIAKVAKSKSVQKTIMILLTLAVLYPNIRHVIDYRVPTVFTKDEVKVLDTLKHIAQREDYVVAWWDYGYPIRYYSDVKTLIDGGKHNGAVNFPVSFALCKPQDVAAKMMYFDVEYTEKRFKEGSTSKWASTNIEQMTLDAGFKNTNDFLATLETDIKLPKKSRDIYLYLPSRMINILPTITLFSNLDLMTGKKGERPFYYNSQNFTSKGSLIMLGPRVSINTKKGQLTIGNRIVNINKFILTKYNKRNKLERQIRIFDRNSDFNVIYMQNYHQIVVMSNDIFNSSFVQLFILENYNPNFYEPVILTPRAKVYKLKVQEHGR